MLAKLLQLSILVNGDGLKANSDPSAISRGSRSSQHAPIKAWTVMPSILSTSWPTLDGDEPSDNSEESDAPAVTSRARPPDMKLNAVTTPDIDVSLAATSARQLLAADKVQRPNHQAGSSEMAAVAATAREKLHALLDQPALDMNAPSRWPLEAYFKDLARTDYAVAEAIWVFVAITLGMLLGIQLVHAYIIFQDTFSAVESCAVVYCM